MRLFLSINFSNRNKKLIQNKVDLLKTKIDEKVKWVKKENWHITVKFLGEVKSDRLARVKNKINEIKSYESFYFQISNVSAFPDLNYPKIVYMGINRGKEKLIEINKELEEKLAELNFEKEKRSFTPHLTIGRSKDYTNIKKLSNQLKNIIDESHFVNIYAKANKISLMKSELKESGPNYKEIFSKNIK